MKTYVHMWYYLAEFFLEWEAFFWKSCRLWDNVGKCGRTRQVKEGNILRRMRLACWITKATDTHFNIAFPRQQ